MVFRPASEAEFAEALSAAGPLWHATDSTWDVACPQGGAILDYTGFTGLSYYSPEDLVVTARAGTRISDLQSALSRHDQCLPIGSVPLANPDPTLAEAIGFAFPHTGEAKFRSWREWILGMTVMLGDGTIAKSGSKVVKSVAGYDAHKLFIGSRGAFGVILEVTLRAFPGSAPSVGTPVNCCRRPWVQRVLKTDFERARALADARVLASDGETATLWGEGDEPIARYDHDWVVRGGPGEMEWAQDEIPFLLRAKTLLDPDRRLNPGALGIC